MAFARAPLLGFVLLAGCARHHPPPAPHAWVSDSAGHEVIAIDLRSGQPDGRIDVGVKPRGLALALDHTLVYAAVADGVAVIDTRTRQVIHKLPVEGGPLALSLSRFGGTVWVSAETSGELVAVDAVSGVERGRVVVGKRPAGVAVRPDGRVVLVAIASDHNVAVVDARSFHVVARIPVADGPRAIVFGDDGRTAYVVSERGRAVTVVDAESFAPHGSIAVTQDAAMPAGVHPSDAALSVDGHTLLVSCGRGGSLALFDVAARKQLRSIDGTGQAPLGVAVDDDGRHVYTANGDGHNVSIVDVTSGNVDRRVFTGGEPWGVVVTD